MPATTSSLPPVPAAEYIQAIALHVSSVCVITTALDGERFGLTATAVSSVSAEPPRLLVCINKSGLTHDKILAAGRFCVNVLAEEQDKVAMVFAGMGGSAADRFETGEWTTLKTGSPVLDRRRGRIRLHARRNMRSVDPSRPVWRCGGDDRTQGK